MKSCSYYPFVAIVEQNKVKQALCIALVNPKAGNLLIGGKKGSGKSVLARSVKGLMSWAKFINLPLNITEDMLFGSIDLECAIHSGEKHFVSGLLGRANGNLIYIDDINLLRTELLSAILNVQSSGVNYVEREGVSYEEDAVFNLIGTMNAEEGTLPNHMLDRFGMYVETEPLLEIENRKEVIKRCLAYEEDSEQFRRCFGEETLLLITKLKQARELVAKIKPAEAMLLLAAQMCGQAACAGHRAELYLLEAAKGLAALAGRNYVLPKDLEEAAVYVLPHRMRKEQKSEQDNLDEREQELEDGGKEQTDDSDAVQQEPSAPQPNATPDSPLSNANNDKDDAHDEQTSENNTKESSNLAPEEQIADINYRFHLPKLLLDIGKSNTVKRGSGKRSVTRTDLKQGRYVRAEQPKGKVEDLAFDATIRAAAPYQRLREPNGCVLNICSNDLRQKVREKRIGSTFLFAVDASGSMGARVRMGAVKGAIFYMLQEAYQKRDRVGMLAFRRDKAEMLLPITRSVDLAQRYLSKMPTGGKTPLAEGLSMAYVTLERMSKVDKELEPVLILITDGRANSSLSGENPVAAALKMAECIRKAGITSMVIDTEGGYVKFGLAREIAKRMGAGYYHIDSLSREKILHLVKNTCIQ